MAGGEWSVNWLVVRRMMDSLRRMVREDSMSRLRCMIELHCEGKLAFYGKCRTKDATKSSVRQFDFFPKRGGTQRLAAGT